MGTVQRQITSIENYFEIKKNINLIIFLFVIIIMSEETILSLLFDKPREKKISKRYQETVQEMSRIFQEIFQEITW